MRIVIAGGGVTGMATAFWLTRMAPDAAVTVIDPDPTGAGGATARSVASIRSQFTQPVNVAISRFGIDFLRDFARWTGPAGGVPDLGLRENGYLFLTRTEAGAAQMEAHAAMQRALGAGTVVVDRPAMAAMFPFLALDDIVAGSFGTRDEGWFDNMGLWSGLRNAARAAGAIIRPGRVTGFRRADDGSIAAVRLADGTEIAADAAVNAAGIHVGALMEGLPTALPVEPRKRTVFVIDARDARHPEAPLIIDPSGLYARPEGSAWIAAAVPDADGPCAPEDEAPDLDLFEAVVWPGLWARMPGFERARLLRWWVGHYDYNRFDQNALIGADPAVPNLYHASGFSGHGLQQAPAVGRGLAELILTGGYRALDLSPLSVQRVAANRPCAESHIV